MDIRINTRSLRLAAVTALILASTNAHAQLVNGDFALNSGSGQLTVNSSLTGWTGGGKEGNFGSQTTPPVFVFAAGTTAQLSSTGVNGDAFMGNVKFYNATAAPSGGVVIAADGDPDWAGSIQQTVNGLTPGTDYILSFNWAGAQQQGFLGNTTERWQVTFGSSSQSTATVNTPSQQFIGWQTANMTFTATSVSQVLRFLAVGSPSGEPPWLLLNNVTLASAAAPEPGSLALLAAVLGGVGIAARRRKK